MGDIARLFFTMVFDVYEESDMIPLTVDKMQGSFNRCAFKYMAELRAFKPCDCEIDYSKPLTIW
jgi:hypothetical protein